MQELSRIPSPTLLAAICIALLPLLPLNAQSADEKPGPQAQEDITDTGRTGGSSAGEADETINPLEQPLQYYYDDLVEKWLHDDSFWKKVRLGGYVAQSYTYNSNYPADGLNSYRAYDRFANSYMFNVFQLSAFADSTTESRLGFGIKANAGRDAQVFVPYNESTSDYFDLYEAWISYLITDELLIKVGKMPTIVGFEVADEKDNYNISRGLLWTLLQPCTHTGVRAIYTDPDKYYDITLGVNRGWDTFRQDNNSALSYEARVGLNPCEKLSYALSYLVGPEQPDNNKDLRHLLDVVATYKASEKTTFGLNGDVRIDEGATDSGQTARAYGLGLYMKHDYTEKCSLAGRVEVLPDKGGAATGYRQTMGEATVTGQYKFRKNVWGRVECRYDQSDKSVFAKGDGTSTQQPTLAASVLITF